MNNQQQQQLFYFIPDIASGNLNFVPVKPFDNLDNPLVQGDAYHMGTITELNFLDFDGTLLPRYIVRANNLQIALNIYMRL